MFQPTLFGKLVTKPQYFWNPNNEYQHFVNNKWQKCVHSNRLIFEQDWKSCDKTIDTATEEVANNSEQNYQVSKPFITSKVDKKYDVKEDEIELILYEVNVDTNNGSQKKDNQISGDKDLELFCKILHISYQRLFSEEVVNQKTFMAALKSAAKLVLRFYDALRIYPHHDTPPPPNKKKSKKSKWTKYF